MNMFFHFWKKNPKKPMLFLCLLGFLLNTSLLGQSFDVTTLDFNGNGFVSQATYLDFGPDGRLYIIQRNGTIRAFTVQRNGQADFSASAHEEISDVKDIQNHFDDGTVNVNTNRQSTGIALAGTPTVPVIYASSSDPVNGGPTGDKNLDTNSGVITRLTKTSTGWDVVDIVRGLPRSEENHATNGLQFFSANGKDYLIVCSGGNTNAGAPSNNFAFITEFALSAAILVIDLTALEGMPILTDGNQGGRKYIYDLPTVDDPLRNNANGINDPNTAGYNGIDENDPWGGNDGLNQAKLVPGGPVQILSSGWRNTYDLAITSDGKLYATENGANAGWGGYPENQGVSGTTTNNYRVGEPGSSSPDGGETQVNNKDHLHLVTTNLAGYISNVLSDPLANYYAGHPVPIRANPSGAGLFTRGSAHSSDPGDSNGNTYTDDWFRTAPYDPDGSTAGSETDPMKALPADWPPYPVSLADPVQGDYRNPGAANPDGPMDDIVTLLNNNSNGIDVYEASTFSGGMEGNLIIGRNNGMLHRLTMNPDGSLNTLFSDVYNVGSNPLGVKCLDNNDPFPGSIWVATFDSRIVILDPDDNTSCLMPGDPGYDANADYDSDGFTNQDEIDNGTDICSGASQPNDFDGDFVSDLNDLDDDGDGINDDQDPFQMGQPFDIPVVNELFSDQPALGGYLGLGLTGLMNNGAPNPNYLAWLDDPDASNSDIDDILGGAVGAVTMYMTAGDAFNDDQEKGFQYGVNVDQTTEPIKVETRLLPPYHNHAAGESHGIFIGNGFQDDYVKIVLDDTGITVSGESGGAVITGLPSVSIAQPSSNLQFIFQINPATGSIQAQYILDDATSATNIGSPFTATGALLQALQQANTPLAVGLIGTNGGTAEFAANWDYLNVIGSGPLITQTLPNLTRLINAPGEDIDLDNYFDDDGGVANLTYTVEANTDMAVGASINGNLLSLTYPGAPTSSMITIRATDADNFFVEQTFTVMVIDPATVLFRVNAFGQTVSAIDGGPDWITDQGATLATNGFEQIGGGSTGLYPGGSWHPSVSQDIIDDTPFSVLETERSDPPDSQNMTYTFDVGGAGNYTVRLFLKNGFGGSDMAGERVFSIEVEGQTFPDLVNIDLSGDYGHQTAIVFEVDVFSDGLLTVEFFTSVNRPIINAIEIIAGAPADPVIVVQPIGTQNNVEGDNANVPVLASGGEPNENYGYAISGAPAGVQIEPTTGLIFGTIATGAATGGPNNDGIYTTTVTVDQPGAPNVDPVDVQFTWIVTESAVGSTWIDLDESENYFPRHECSFVQAGEHFFLFGGREASGFMDIYDYQNNTWTNNQLVPEEFNHFQAVEYQGLIWVIGAFKTNDFPNEIPADKIHIYDPVNSVWIEGPDIPVARRRGAAGLSLYNGKFYIVGGNTMGHSGGFVPWTDEYDPATNTWTVLNDAPNARDHFHTAVIGDKLYATAGRQSGGTGGVFAPMIATVDVYDFNTNTWTALPASSNIPTPRGGAFSVPFLGKVLVGGGEGSGFAHQTTEAFDPSDNTWETLDDMNHGRHGTQGIVSGQGVYVTAGSFQQGGGNQRNMEVYGEDNPQGVALAGSTLSAPGTVVFNPASSEIIDISNSGGNQGIFIQSLIITGGGAGDFSIVAGDGSNFLLFPNSTHQVTIAYAPASPGPSATLEITYSNGQVINVILDVTGFMNEPPVVTNPGTQTGTDGDAVNLAITATDDNDCGGLVYSATGLPPSLDIDPSTGVISGIIDPEIPNGGSSFLETDGPNGETGGFVAIEAESGNLPAMGWTTGTDSGIDYVEATASHLSDPGGDLIAYDIEISSAGVYRFEWRTEIPDPNSPGDNNDSWLKFPNNDNVWFFGYKGLFSDEQDIIDALQSQQQENVVFPKGSSRITTNTTPAGLGGNGFFKVFRSGANPWIWYAKTSDLDGHDIFVWFVNPGTYTMQVGNRSAGHQIDKIVMYKIDTYGNNYPDATMTAAAESPIGGSVPGASANSPYNVTVTATDMCSPALDHSVNFSWIVNPAGGGATANLTLTEEMQGRTDHSGDFNVKLYDPNDNTTPLYDVTATANAAGVLNMSNITPGSYDVWIKHDKFISRVAQDELLTAGANSVSFISANNTELRGGDANNDNKVTALDFSILAGSFNEQSGMPDYDDRADFNGDLAVTALDFSILSSNFNTLGEEALLPGDDIEIRGNPPVPHALVDLKLSMDHGPLTVGDEFVVWLAVEAGNQPIDAMEAHLKFDPAKLEIVDLIMTDALNLPLRQSFDNATGSIHLAAGSFFQHPLGEVTLAQITFRAKAAGQTAVALPDVLDGRTQEVTYGGVLILDQVVELPIEVGTTVVPEMAIALYPVPSQGKVTLEVSAPADPQSIAVRIFDAAGKQVFQTLYKESVRETLDFSNLSKGVYFVEVISGSEIRHTRMTLE